MNMIIFIIALILFGLCMATDNMIEARQPRSREGMDQKSYL